MAQKLDFREYLQLLFSIPCGSYWGCCNLVPCTGNVSIASSPSKLRFGSLSRCWWIICRVIAALLDNPADLSNVGLLLEVLQGLILLLTF
uniref:ATP-dependent RNA helicase DHX36 isoform X2 n=1 Tax=Rhizophora mucronata TaxID=61149 RepID=A0A2P2MK59_RHIMU